MASSAVTAVAVDYPSSDGKPVAESDFQLTPLTYARDRLRHHFRNRSDVYVAGNLFIYYEEGNGQAVVAPDVFVVMGAPNHDRPSYRLWEEPKGPDFVLEITSRTTRDEDQGPKRTLYRRLGVQEYWQYDPTGDYLNPVLQGAELVEGDYEPLPARWLADGTLVMTSAVLGLQVRISERGLRFHDAATGQDLLNLAETDAARRREQQARQAAEQARQREQQAAQARIAELEALLRRERERDSAHEE